MTVRSGRGGAALAVGVVVALLAGLVQGWPVVPAAAAELPVPVTATPLPTAQIDGVAWDQVVSGDTVYVGGKFGTVRPAGAAPGQDTVVRQNVMAYDISTGQYKPGFVVDTNAQVLGMAMSPDGATLYIAGDFTSVNGVARYRMAAVDAATGQVRNFKPGFDYRVSSVVVTDGAVYAGGSFGRVGSAPRTRLAALDPVTARVLDWAPVADGGAVLALAQLPGSDRITVGGAFTSLNGVTAHGSGAVDAVSGATLGFPVNQVIQNSGTSAAIYSLRADAGTNRVYGTGYTYGAGGNFEGTFASDAAGNLVWINDRRGDHYDTFVSRGILYSVGHAHQISNVAGGTPESTPWKQQYATAETAERTGVLQPPNNGRFNFSGNGAPTLLHWFPEYTPGEVTGATQASWTVEGNDRYLVTAGEFTAVDGLVQQGLVRFTYREYAPSQDRPRDSGPNLVPRLTSPAAGTVQVSFQTTWDRDDAALDYEVQRDGQVVKTFQGVRSHFTNRPVLTFIDDSPGVSVGQTQRYRVVAVDGAGLRAVGDYATVPVGGSGSLLPYARTVLADNPTTYRRLGDSGSATADAAYGWAGSSTSGITRAVGGAIVGDADTAFRFSSGSAAQTSALPTPREMSTEAWVRTTTSKGGFIAGWTTAQSGTGGTVDYATYMGNDGRIRFGVYEVARSAITSPEAYNDGQWHHVVSTLDWATGMTLYVDGEKVSGNPDVRHGHDLRGYWRVGGASLANFPSRPSSDYISADIDEVATYLHALPADRVAEHYRVGRGGTVNEPPVAVFDAGVSGLSVSVDGSGSSDPEGSALSFAWDFGDGSSGAGATASHTYAAAGTYPVVLTVTDADGAAGSVSQLVSVAPAGQPVPVLVDAFGRSVASGWGDSDNGVPWAVSGSGFSVAGGQGLQAVARGRALTASSAVAAADVDLVSTVSLDKVPADGSMYVSFGVRSDGSSAYIGRLRFLSDGTVWLNVQRKVGGSAAVIGGGALPGVTYAAGMLLGIRVQVSGEASPTVRVKAWDAAAQSEASVPWAAEVVDAVGGVPASGGVYLETYLSSGTSNGPVTVRFDDLGVSATR